MANSNKKYTIIFKGGMILLRVSYCMNRAMNASQIPFTFVHYIE